ncbi:MAG: T9SS type A sorting domain-containing protein [Flavobacteriales bacterium]
MKNSLILIIAFAFSLVSNAQNICEELSTNIISQNPNQVELQSAGIVSIFTPTIYWEYFDQQNNGGSDQGSSITLFNLSPNQTIIVIQTYTLDSLSCTTIDTLVFQDQQWMMTSSPGQDDVEGCTNPFAINYNPQATIEDGSCFDGCVENGEYYCVGCEFFVDSCNYYECLGDGILNQNANEWSELNTIDGCLTYDCIANGCIDVGQFGQEGSYASLQECEQECSSNQELIYECLAGSCVDVGQFGQEGSYASLQECEQECSSNEDFIYECILGNCVDVSQFGQSGSFESLQACEEECISEGDDSSFECIAGACIDIGQFGQEGSFDTLEECEDECEANAQSSYECIAGACIDIGQFGQEGSFDSLEECENECENNNQSSYNCIMETCVDVGQFGQEGTFASLEECENECATVSSITDNSNHIFIAPNPFEKSTTISLNQKAIRYELFDTKARKVRSQTINSESFIIYKDNLNAGLYFISIICDDQIIQQKLILK